MPKALGCEDLTAHTETGVTRHVYSFGAGAADGGAHMKDILGGKGANLAEMSSLGIPVPPGFTISAQLCGEYLRQQRLPEFLKDEVRAAMRQLEETSGRTFGGADNPLLVSVRSGAKVSMPGMMDTILNLGLNDATAAGLAAQSHNEAFAYDSFRRFVQMYGDVVFNLKRKSNGDGNGNGHGSDPFEEALEQATKRHAVKRAIDLSGAT